MMFPKILMMDSLASSTQHSRREDFAQDLYSISQLPPRAVTGTTIEKKIAPIDAVNKSLGNNLKVQLSQGAAIVRRPQRGRPSSEAGSQAAFC
jgi:hypothetical protein